MSLSQAEKLGGSDDLISLARERPKRTSNASSASEHVDAAACLASLSSSFKPAALTLAAKPSFNSEIMSPQTCDHGSRESDPDIPAKVKTRKDFASKLPPDRSNEGGNNCIVVKESPSLAGSELACGARSMMVDHSYTDYSLLDEQTLLEIDNEKKDKTSKLGIDYHNGLHDKEQGIKKWSLTEAKEKERAEAIRNLKKIDEKLAASKRNSGGVLQPFPEKLMEVLDRSDMNSIISWMPHGRAFIVRQPKFFAENVLPRFFKQSKYMSFTRQVNLWGFKRITRGLDSGAYYHELFLRGYPRLTTRMRRQKIKGTGIKLAPNPNFEPNFYALSTTRPLIVPVKEKGIKSLSLPSRLDIAKDRSKPPLSSTSSHTPGLGHVFQSRLSCPSEIPKDSKPSASLKSHESESISGSLHLMSSMGQSKRPAGSARCHLQRTCAGRHGSHMETSVKSETDSNKKKRNEEATCALSGRGVYGAMVYQGLKDKKEKAEKQIERVAKAFMAGVVSGAPTHQVRNIHGDMTQRIQSLRLPLRPPGFESIEQRLANSSTANHSLQLALLQQTLGHHPALQKQAKPQVNDLLGSILSQLSDSALSTLITQLGEVDACGSASRESVMGHQGLGRPGTNFSSFMGRSGVASGPLNALASIVTSDHQAQCQAKQQPEHSVMLNHLLSNIGCGLTSSHILHETPSPILSADLISVLAQRVEEPMQSTVLPPHLKDLILAQLKAKAKDQRGFGP